jgi:PAS domain S-box-containing protein
LNRPTSPFATSGEGGTTGQIAAPLAGSYDDRVVVLSIFIAISASYAALDLCGRISAARGWARPAWLVGGALALGVGIWSMHFTGMLAFRLPVPISYNWPIVLLSLLEAVLASAIALYLVSGSKIWPMPVLIGGVIIGCGITAMHYTAMASMRLAGECRFHPFVVALSIVFAILFSFAALWLAFHFRSDSIGNITQRIVSAFTLGTAISAMHYIGMAAATFVPSAAPPDLTHALSISSLGVAAIASVTLLIQALAIVTSVVDRRFAAQSLEIQNSERFRQIADTLPVVLALATSDFSELLYANRAYQEIWGRPVESFYADPKFWLQGVHEEDRGRVEESVQRLVGGKPIENLEFRVVRPDGSVRCVLARGYPIRDAQGRPYRVVGSAQDITERKRLEEARRDVEEQHRMVVETATDAVVSIDQDSQILYVNPATTNIFGYESSELIGRSLTMLMPEFLRDLHRAGLQRYLATGQRHISWHGVELSGLRKNREKFPVEISFGEVVKQDRRLFTGFIRDITERKRAEEELYQLSGRLLRLQDEERRRIARDLHDTTGQNLVALATMLGQLDAAIPAFERKPHALLAGCKTLADLCIREVRTLSFILHPPVLDQAGLEDALHDYVEGFTNRSGIQVELELPPRLERMPRDVELTLFRVVQESLTNIQRHSGSPQAKIRILRSSNLILEISDRGHGIAASRQHDKADRRLEMGVGLHSMRERVKLVGGRLEIASSAEGTTVRVTIPLPFGAERI